MNESDADSGADAEKRVAMPQDATRGDAPTDAPPDADRPTNAQMLAYFLQHTDARCPACRYNLHALRSNRCPECGRALVLAVHAEQPTPWAWVATVAAFTLGAGLGVLALIVVIVTGDFPPFDEVPGLALAMCYFIACIPLSIVTMAAKRVFSRASLAAGVVVAAIAALTTLVMFVTLIVSIFSW